MLGGKRVVRAFDVIEVSGAIRVLAAAITDPIELTEVYASVAGEDPRRLTDLTRSLRERVELIAPERFIAVSADGVEVECWAMAPRGVEAGDRAPTILNIHGGPFTSYGWFFFDEFQLQVSAGFGVIYCNPRGSSGYSEAWGRAIRWPEAETDPGSGWGGVDYNDVMACVDEACKRFDWIDDARLGVQGGSYGGYMTSWIVGHTDRFVAACSERAANNLLLLECTSDAGWSFRTEVGFTHLDRSEAVHTPLALVVRRRHAYADAADPLRGRLALSDQPGGGVVRRAATARAEPRIGSFPRRKSRAVAFRQSRPPDATC